MHRLSLLSRKKLFIATLYAQGHLQAVRNYTWARCIVNPGLAYDNFDLFKSRKDRFSTDNTSDGNSPPSSETPVKETIAAPPKRKYTRKTKEEKEEEERKKEERRLLKEKKEEGTNKDLKVELTKSDESPIEQLTEPDKPAHVPLENKADEQVSVDQSKVFSSPEKIQKQEKPRLNQKKDSRFISKNENDDRSPVDHSAMDGHLTPTTKPNNHPHRVRSNEAVQNRKHVTSIETELEFVDIERGPLRSDAQLLRELEILSQENTFSLASSNRDDAKTQSRQENSSIDHSRNKVNVSEHNDDDASKSEQSTTSFFSSPDFNVRDHQLSIGALMKAGVHLGHTTSRWNPKMRQYIAGIRDGIHLIDMNKTIVLLRQSLTMIREVAKRNGIILFVGHQPAFKEAIMEAAKKCEQYFLVEKWTAGTLTNSFETLKTSQFLPDLIIFFDVNYHEKLGLKEAKQCELTTIGICDTDCNPELVTFPIPGNNDSVRAVGFYAHLFSAAALEGRQMGKAMGLLDREEGKRWQREPRERRMRTHMRTETKQPEKVEHKEMENVTVESENIPVESEKVTVEGGESSSGKRKKKKKKRRKTSTEDNSTTPTNDSA